MSSPTPWRVVREEDRTKVLDANDKWLFDVQWDDQNRDAERVVSAVNGYPERQFANQEDGGERA